MNRSRMIQRPNGLRCPDCGGPIVRGESWLRCVLCGGTSRR